MNKLLEMEAFVQVVDTEEDGRLLAILEDWTNEPLPIHVVYPQNLYLSAKVRVFVDWIAALFSNHATVR